MSYYQEVCWINKILMVNGYGTKGNIILRNDFRKNI